MPDALRPVLPVLLGVDFGGVLVVLGGMQVMAVRDLGVVRRLFVIAGLVVLGRLAMVLGRVLVVFRSQGVVLVNFVIGHRCLPDWPLVCGRANLASAGETIATEC